MTRQEKTEVVEFLTDAFKSADGIAICDYKGLTVAALESLRKDIREAGGKVRVVKNTLAMIAFKNAGIETELAETNVLVWSDDQIDLAKRVVKFAKSNSDHFVVKAGYMGGKFYNAADVETLSKMPSREELIGMLLSVWQAPLRNMAYVMQAPLANLAAGLGNLADKKQKESA